MRSKQVSTYCVAILSMFASVPATAQDPKQGGGLQIAQVSGTMQAMALNQIKVLAEDKKEYFVVLSDQTSLQYRGTAEPDFLTQGLFVRFTADLNQTGLAQAPVKELEVFTYSQNRRMTPEQIREQTAGVYQLGNEAGNDKKAGAKETPKKSQGKQAAAAGAAQTYRVVGQVVGSQAGKMFVQAGSVRVQFELDPKAVINVTARDTTFIQMGDEVKVSGLRNAAQEQYIQSESIEIKGVKPLGPAEGKAGAKNAKSSKTKGKGAKGSSKDDDSDDKKAGAKKDNATDTDSKKSDSKKTAPK